MLLTNLVQHVTVASDETNIAVWAEASPAAPRGDVQPLASSLTTQYSVGHDTGSREGVGKWVTISRIIAAARNNINIGEANPKNNYTTNCHHTLIIGAKPSSINIGGLASLRFGSQSFMEFLNLRVLGCHNQNRQVTWLHCTQKTFLKRNKDVPSKISFRAASGYDCSKRFSFQSCVIEHHLDLSGNIQPRSSYCSKTINGGIH